MNKIFVMIISVFIFLLQLSPVYSDAVKNVRTFIDIEDRLVIEYDLEGSGTYTVSVTISTDGGASYPIKPISLSGDVGENIRVGINKRIVWDVFMDIKKLSSNVAVKITASQAVTNEYKQDIVFQEKIKNFGGVTEIQGIMMVSIPGGSFQMGSNDGDSNEKPVHTVKLSSFEMSATEITQEQYKAVMGTNPSYFTGDDNLPVEMVSWNDAVAFCRALSQKTGSEFRLPTEAEWEYACRAGTTTKYNLGDNESDLARTGWYKGNSGGKPHPVGQKTPNSFGLYDMHGNVFEWCNDWYGVYSSENATSPKGAQTGSDRVIRGGGWGNDAGGCRSAYRNWSNPSGTGNGLGFRVVRRP